LPQTPRFGQRVASALDIDLTGLSQKLWQHEYQKITRFHRVIFKLIAVERWALSFRILLSWLPVSTTHFLLNNAPDFAANYIYMVYIVGSDYRTTKIRLL